MIAFFSCCFSLQAPITSTMKIHSLLVVLLAYFVNGVGASVYEPKQDLLSHMKTAIESERYNQNKSRSAGEVHKLFRVYIKQHSVHVLRSESDEQLCKRNFVTNHHFSLSCQSLGNSLGSGLNNALYAVTLNRTYLAQNNVLDRTCYGYLSLFPWVPSFEEIQTRLENSACPLPSDILEYDGFPKVGYSAQPNRIVSEDNLFNCLPEHLRDDPTVHSFVRARAHLLFKAKNGKYEPYGVISSLMFNMSTIVHTSVEASIRNVGKDALTVGVHLRHYGNIDSAQDLIQRSMKHLYRIRNLHKSEQCVVYFASDSNKSIDTVIPSASAINCSVVSVAAFLQENPLPHAHVVHSFPDDRKEHGPLAHGLIQIADVLLLSSARYFIGIGQSTYSIFIANYVAAHNMDEGLNEKYLFWVQSSPSRR